MQGEDKVFRKTYSIQSFLSVLLSASTYFMRKGGNQSKQFKEGDQNNLPFEHSKVISGLPINPFFRSRILC